MRSKLTVAIVAPLFLVLAGGCMVLGDAEGIPSNEEQADESEESQAKAQPARQVQRDHEKLVENGQYVYEDNCASCHRSGMAGAPELTGVTDRLTQEEFDRILDEGPGSMPSWEYLSDKRTNQIWAFLGSAEAKQGGLLEQTETAGGGCGCGGGGGGSKGSCGCGGGAGSCGAAAAKVAKNDPEPDVPNKPSGGGGGCGCGK